MRNKTHRQTKTRRPESSRTGLSWKYSALTVMCGSILVVGFFFAARQHFSSMDYGIKNSRLRKQLGELESEKRRLLLTREVSLSPSELIKAVRKIGLTQTAEDPGAVRTVQYAETPKAKSADANGPVIQKTVLSEPVQPAKSASESKPAKLEKQAKKESDGRDKKDKS